MKTCVDLVQKGLAKNFIQAWHLQCIITLGPRLEFNLFVRRKAACCCMVRSMQVMFEMHYVSGRPLSTASATCQAAYSGQMPPGDLK